ncbi:serine hydrolase domain-containing protein [Flavobacterium mesophilum]|uniref:serine hydrolase domain-containing protein n=1 Tax=Flavobacterium mesophilum TaxID=3143495 RepID=UPI0031D84AC1
MKRLFTQTVFFFLCLNSYCQNFQSEKELDQLFTSHFSSKTPGCSVLVSQNGKIIYEKAFGSANLELNVPAKPQTVFSLASITKQFTAISILQLVSQRKIALTDNVQKYIPDFPANNILIENLLSHTSGLKDYLHVDTGQKYGERLDYTPSELINIFKNIPLEYEPGTKYAYCNSDYILLGYIIEKVSGKTYSEYLSENIFIPLEMTDTYYDSDEKIINNRSSGYFKAGDQYGKVEFWSATIGYAAGGLLSTSIDLQKWQAGLLSYKILKKELLDLAFTPFKLKDGTSTNYGFGWNITEINGLKRIDHGGAKNGFLTYEAYFPDQQLYIVLLFNSENAPRDELSIKVPEILLRKSLQKETILNDDVLKTYIGVYSLTSEPKRTITITKVKDGLSANISGQGSFPLIFQSETQFQLKNLLDIKCEFKITNGKVISIIVEQQGKFEWMKIK